MDLKKQNKLLIISVILLLVANIATVSAIWFNKQASQINKQVMLRNKDCNMQKNSKNYFVEKLNLSDDQALLAKQIRITHFKETQQLKASIELQKQNIHTELFKPLPDTALIMTLSDSIGKLNAEFEKLNYEHFMKLKEILEPNQQEKLKQLMDEASMHHQRKDRNQKRQHRPFN